MTSRRQKQRDAEIDLLLVSIIRAYKHPDKRTDQARLAEARRALFGETPKMGRPSTYDVLADFKVQDNLRKREKENLILGIAKKHPNVLTPEWEDEILRDPISARAAARKFKGLAGTSENVEDDSVEDRLRRKARDKMSAKEMAINEALFDPEAPHTKTLVNILELLETLGVQSKTIWDESD